ncbi:DUF3261 domain-containing protein [Shewanella sp. AS1]|uniref:DUF3261 domain-containing protein n=1 Tax=Shewanella sp. AS1 TaxID=2907626 RepID=UPI001F313CE7|nr:DUF3261 domain-containing protein [Shewanella sp. AS1]MCE9680355.1 DUF3261 domain-containing protein [Shewanella sp. AS1]
MPMKWSSLLPLGLTLCLMLGLILTIGGCAQRLDRDTCMNLTSDVSYCLAPLQNDLSLSQTQKVNLEVDGSKHQLLSQLELTPEQLTLVGLAPLGQALFTLTFDGKRLESQQSALLGEAFKGEYLLALLQLIYWPIEEANLQLRGAVLRTIACEATHCRGLYSDNTQTQVLEIRYSQTSPWQAQVILTFEQAKLTLKITPLA